MELKDISISIINQAIAIHKMKMVRRTIKGITHRGSYPKSYKKRYWKKQNGTIMECAMNFLKVLNKL